MKYCEKYLAKNGNFDFFVMTSQTSCGAFRQRERVMLQTSCGAERVKLLVPSHFFCFHLAKKTYYFHVLLCHKIFLPVVLGNLYSVS